MSTLLFYEGKLCDPTFLAKVKDEMDRFIRLVPVVEQLIRDWHPLERASADGVLIRPVEVAAMRQVMGDLIASREQGGGAFDDETLAATVADRVRMLEAVAVVFFAEAVAQLPDQELPDGAADRSLRDQPEARPLGG